MKNIVGENVTALMRAKKLSQPQVALLAKQQGRKIDQTTVGRIARAAIPTTVDTLDAIAAGLGVEPWALLVPDLNPAELPAIGVKGLAPDERELLERYRGASSRWKVSIRYMIRMERDQQQEEALGYLLSKIFATPVSDERVEAAYGVPGQKAPVVLHESRAAYRKGKK